MVISMILKAFREQKRQNYWVANTEYTAILQGKLLGRSQAMTSV